MQIDGDLETTIKFIDSLKIPYIAPSFGGCESIVDQPAILSYWYWFGFLVYVVILMESIWMWPCNEIFLSGSFLAAVFIVCVYFATGIFLHLKGPSGKFMTIWFASVLELKILRIWRLISCRHWRSYRQQSSLFTASYFPFLVYLIVFGSCMCGVQLQVLISF